MVERLKAAVEKARMQRQIAGEAAPSTSRPPSLPDAVSETPPAWARLPAATLDPATLADNRIVTIDKTHPAHTAIDLLRTRLQKVCRENGWRKIGLSSPNKGCGKTTIAANLAFSAARNNTTRVLLCDLDMKQPHLAGILGLHEPRSAGEFLRGERSPEEYFVRLGSNIAVGLGRNPEPNSAELMHSASTSAAIGATLEAFKPDVMFFDLPPMLMCDDVIGFLHNLDGLILIAAAGQTRSHEIEECERLLEGGCNFLGVVLNKHESDPDDIYKYDYYGSS